MLRYSKYIIPAAILFFFISYYYLDKPATEWAASLAPWVKNGAKIADSTFDAPAFETIWPLIFFVYAIILGKSELRKDLLFIMMAIPAAVLTITIIKVFAGRARPELWLQEGIYGFYGLSLSDAWHSFPSRHAATTSGLMASLYCFYPRWAIFYVVIAFILGATRILSIDHYLSDVVLGIVISFFVVSLLYIPYQRRVVQWKSF